MLLSDASLLLELTVPLGLLPQLLHLLNLLLLKLISLFYLGLLQSEEPDAVLHLIQLLLSLLLNPVVREHLEPDRLQDLLVVDSGLTVGAVKG